MPLFSSTRSNFGPSSRGRGNVSDFIVDVSPSVSGKTRYNLSKEKLIISTAGEWKVTPIAPTNSQVTFKAKCWGAGGYGGNRAGWSQGYSAGGGGYAEANIFYQGPFTIIVGGAGLAQNIQNSVTFGGGHTSHPPNGGTSDMRYSAGGGGFSGLMTGLETVHTTSNGSTNNYQSATTQARSIIIAGGGGGGGVQTSGGSNRGGAGGGADGQGGELASAFRAESAGRISTNTVGTWVSSNVWNPSLPTSLSSFGIPQRMCAGPGEGETYGAGGGGGYWAGTCSGTNGNNMGGGGGGSGYIHPVFGISGQIQSQGNLTVPPQQANVDYVAGRGVGGSATSNVNGGSYAAGGIGGDGLVVLGPA